MRSILIVALAATSASAQPALPQKDPIPLVPELTEVPPPVVARPVGDPKGAPLVPIPADPKLERAAAVQLCAERDPQCDWMARLGGLERESVARVLSQRGMEIEPQPWGKVIEDVIVFNEDVFAEKSKVLRFFNNFHATTRPHVIAYELVIGKGEVWDQTRVEEAARRLRDPLWTSVVAAIPVKAKDATKVVLLVVTRDVWSLRLNTKYELSAGSNQDTKLTYLTVSISENNLFGRRAALAAAMTMDQNNVALGPIFIDKNVVGEHYDLRIRADALFNRDKFTRDGELVREGSDSTITLNRLLWSLATEWAFGASFSHAFQIERSFIGTDLRTFDDPATDEVEAYPWVYDSKVISASAYATRQWGAGFKHQISAGYGASSVRAEPYQFVGSAEQLSSFRRGVLPRTEVQSGPYVEYAGFDATFKTLRNIQTYDVTEDTRFGFDYSLLIGGGAKLLGADFDHVRGSASAGYTVRWCRDGFVRASGTVSMRRQNGVREGLLWIDNTASGRVRIASPSQRWGRVVFDSSIATRWNDTQNRFFTTGDSLRGFVTSQFSGDRVFATQVEARSIPFRLWFFRVGGVAFYELGGAANSLTKMPLHHDVGFGARLLIPQTSRELLRFDLAFPLDGRNAGTPRFIAGFESAF